jgi:hypothetical protein
MSSSKEYPSILPPPRISFPHRPKQPIRRPGDPILPPGVELPPSPLFQATVQDEYEEEEEEEEEESDNRDENEESSSRTNSSESDTQSEKSYNSRGSFDEGGADLFPPIDDSVEKAPLSNTPGYYNPGTRLQALSLLEFGVLIYYIVNIIGIRESIIYRIRKRAIKRGYNPDVCKKILLYYVEDAPKTGRPDTPPHIKRLIIDIMKQNSTTRAWSSGKIAGEVCKRLGIRKAISASTVYRELKDQGYSSCKQTVKPGLTDAMKKARLLWCLERKDWTLEDWKKVIWTDETSVALGGIRGKRRVWRTPEETHHPHCIKRR